MKKTLQDYKSIIEPVWCPGCGDYGILVSIQKALLNLDIEPENIVSVSGIGCSGRLSHFLNTYSNGLLRMSLIKIRLNPLQFV